MAVSGSVSDGKFGDKAPGFDGSTRLPLSDAERQAWQEANKAWWEAQPMRYDWRDGLNSDRATESYFKEIDERFFSSVRRFLPWRKVPFDTLVPFDELNEKDVLEIGVGHGSHGSLLAPRARFYTGIDLTLEATEMTRKRFALFNIPGTILQMDAENMQFPAGNFDFIWSWGVIHHSADTLAILKEMHRVLRPGGQSIVMVYYRSWWSYYLFALLKRVLEGKFPTIQGMRETRQEATDGAIARYYTCAEWKKFVAPYFSAETSVHGMNIELIPLPHGRLKDFLLRIMPDGPARFMTHNLAMGSFLVARMTKL